MGRVSWWSYLSVISLIVFAASAGAEPPRSTLWIDAYEGEPTPYGAVLDDLAQARVVYLGERHTLERHHATQAAIVNRRA